MRFEDEIFEGAQNVASSFIFFSFNFIYLFFYDLTSLLLRYLKCHKQVDSITEKPALVFSIETTKILSCFVYGTTLT